MSEELKVKPTPKDWEFQIGEHSGQCEVRFKGQPLNMVNEINIKAVAGNLTTAEVKVIVPLVQTVSLEDKNVHVINRDEVIEKIKLYMQVCRIYHMELR